MVRDSSPPTADNTSNGVSNGGGISSPHSRNRSLWASVVRGGDSDQNLSPTAAESSPPAEHTSNNTVIENSSSEAQPESFEDINGDTNVGLPRRPAWNRPLNGAAAEPASSVIGGVASWPALSETTRPITRSPSDVSRPVSDGSAALSQAPIISQPPQRLVNNSGHSNSTANNSNPGRPRSRNRGGGGGGGGGGSIGGGSGGGPSPNTYNQPSLPMPPPFPVFEVPYGMLPAAAVHDNSGRGVRPIGGTSQSHSGIENSSQRSNSRRAGYGTRPRGEHHNNHGGRRDQDRRDAHHPPQYVPPPMGYLPPPLPAGAGPFLPPPHMRVFPGFDMPPPFYYVQPMPPPESFRAMPIVPPLAPMIFPPANEDPITSMIVKQIDFYFSDDNLVKDSFLRSKMDDQGWVPIGLIASFRRVQQLTKDISLILESLRHSTVVEVQGDKVRKSNDWSKWLLLSGSGNSDSGSHTPTSASDVLAASLREVSLDDSGTNVNGMDAMEGHVEASPRIGDDCAEDHHTS